MCWFPFFYRGEPCLISTTFLPTFSFYQPWFHYFLPRFYQINHFSVFPIFPIFRMFVFWVLEKPRKQGIICRKLQCFATICKVAYNSQNPISIFSGFELPTICLISQTAWFPWNLVFLVEWTCQCVRFFYQISTNFPWLFWKMRFDSKSACGF